MPAKPRATAVGDAARSLRLLLSSTDPKARRALPRCHGRAGEGIEKLSSSHLCHLHADLCPGPHMMARGTTRTCFRTRCTGQLFGHAHPSFAVNGRGRKHAEKGVCTNLRGFSRATHEEGPGLCCTWAGHVPSQPPAPLGAVPAPQCTLLTPPSATR